MNDQLDINELDSDKYEKLSSDSQEDVKSEIADMFLADPDEALNLANELDISEDEIFEYL